MDQTSANAHADEFAKVVNHVLHTLAVLNSQLQDEAQPIGALKTNITTILL